MFLLFKLVLEIFFPTKCVACSRFGELVCDRCFSGIRVESTSDNQQVKFINTLYVAANLKQEVLQKSIYYYKYHGIKRISDYLNVLLEKYFENLQNNFFELYDYDGVACVPLSKRRYGMRGFNQSEILAHFIANYLDVDFLGNLLNRKHSNKNQVDLDHEDRLLNVADKIFFSEKYSVKNKTILLIDDIVTTGSTLSECAKVLKKHGAKRVDALVLAKNKY